MTADGTPPAARAATGAGDHLPAGPTGSDVDDHRLAVELAMQTGALLVKLLERHRLEAPDPRHGLDELRDEGDRAAHEFLATALAEARPDDAVLSEEAPDDRRRLNHRRVWIIDPLDGTRQYGEPGRSDWAVHVALVISGVPVVGAVALPAEGVTLSTAEPPTLSPWLPGGDNSGARKQVITSRSRPVPDGRAVAAALGAKLVTLGSVGAKVAEVIRGRAVAYVHAGGQSEWDSAAPVAVALACGLHASRLDGRPLRYNRPDVELPDLLICRPEVAAAALAATVARAAPAAG
ncbi:MAG: 3'(2'),5'-bisphosphate nucleotidase CysQ [bacterium]|nr:3'(2'),5'-bisphosphate nucleotidase CysQ [bacterium]